MKNKSENETRKLYLATVCNDLANAQDYTVDGKDCYYKGGLIGKMTIDIAMQDNKLVQNVYFTPLKAVESITVDLTISKPGESFKANENG